MTSQADGVLRIQPTQVPIDVDRRSAMPLYHQVYEQLAAAILDGTLAEGERFETELSLARRLGVSRLTIRRTLAELVSHGLLVRGRGTGTFVTYADERVARPLGVRGQVCNPGQPKTRTLRIEYPVTEAEVAVQLGLDAGTRLLYVERLWVSDGVGLAVMRNWLPPAGVSMRSLDLSAQGLYASLREHSMNPKSTETSIGARLPSSAEREMLGLGDNDPVLTVRGVTRDAAGCAVDYADHTVRADGRELDLTLSGQDGLDGSVTAPRHERHRTGGPVRPRTEGVSNSSLDP